MRINSIKAIAVIGIALVAISTIQVKSGANGAGMLKVHAAPYDLQFIDMMIMHHQHGIEMARLAEGKAQLQQLKDFSKRVITDQEKDIAELQDRRSRMYANQPKAESIQMQAKKTTMGEMMKMMEDHMNKLRSSTGKAFDRIFLDLFTKHHQMAIQMSRDALKKAERAEIKEFARKSIDKQSRDIKEMDGMKQKVNVKGSK